MSGCCSGGLCRDTGAAAVSTLDPMSHYGSHVMPATERFLDGFLPWAADAVGVVR